MADPTVPAEIPEFPEKQETQPLETSEALCEKPAEAVSTETSEAVSEKSEAPTTDPEKHKPGTLSQPASKWMYYSNEAVIVGQLSSVVGPHYRRTFVPAAERVAIQVETSQTKVWGPRLNEGRSAPRIDASAHHPGILDLEIPSDSDDAARAAWYQELGAPTPAEKTAEPPEKT